MRSWRLPLKIFTYEQSATFALPVEYLCHICTTKEIPLSRTQTCELCSISTENAIQLLLVDVLIKIEK